MRPREDAGRAVEDAAFEDEPGAPPSPLRCLLFLTLRPRNARSAAESAEADAANAVADALCPAACAEWLEGEDVSAARCAALAAALLSPDPPSMPGTAALCSTDPPLASLPPRLAVEFA